MKMQHSAPHSLSLDIGRTLLGLAVDDAPDTNTIFARTASAFRSVNEPTEAVDLLLTAITLLSECGLDASQSDPFKRMAAEIQDAWLKKTSSND